MVTHGNRISNILTEQVPYLTYLPVVHAKRANLSEKSNFHLQLPRAALEDYRPFLMD